MTDVDDKRLVEDYIWFEKDYKQCFKKARLELVIKHYPLGKKDDLFKWMNETEIAPWVIYVLKRI